MHPRDLPVQRKLLWVLACAAGLAVTLYLLALLMADARGDTTDARAQLQAVAEVLALQGAQALQANDPAAAAASLAGLQARTDVRRAVLRRVDGSVVAVFPAGADATASAQPQTGTAGQVVRIVIEQPVQLAEGRRLGSLRLDADLTEQQQVSAAIALLMAAIAAAFAVALVLAARKREVGLPLAADTLPEAPAQQHPSDPAPAPPAPPADTTRVPPQQGPRDPPALLADPPALPTAADAMENVNAPADKVTAPRSPAPVAPARPLHARVLLAEDNQVNREIATVMLQAMGCKVTQAHDGAQALAAVLSRDIDLVLMDCGMPVMDGFESTRRIRAWERDQPGRVRVPIVALTASALAGDREACLSAGMDDYLVKPVSSSRLSETLARHLSGPGRRVPASVPAAEPVQQRPAAAAVPVRVYDAAVLASLPMVADGSHPGFVHRMQCMFAESNARALAEIDAALAGNDTPTLMRLLHSMKSASAQVGAMELSALARSFESHLLGGGSPSPQWPAQLRQAFERLLAAWPEVRPAEAPP